MCRLLFQRQPVAVMLASRHLFVLAILVCCSTGVPAERWRFALKRLEQCDGGAELAVAWRDLKVTFLQHGDVFRLDCVITIVRDTNVTAVQTELFKDGVLPIKFMSWRNNDACKLIADGESLFAPLFGPNGIPRTCYFKQGRYATRMEFDMNGEMPGCAVRASLAFRVTMFAGRDAALCVRGHGFFKKNKRAALGGDAPN